LIKDDFTKAVDAWNIEGVNVAPIFAKSDGDCLSIWYTFTERKK
jgi:hypothetical protein